MTFSPTPHPDVNLVLERLFNEVQAILGDQFVGMYLYGSLANGGFDRDSDVDFLVVTSNVLSDERFAALDEMHQSMATMDVWCATQLEGSYVPRAALRQYDPVHALHIHIDRGAGERLKRMHLDTKALHRGWWGGWVILRAQLYTCGITLAGPDPKTLVDPVSSDDLRQAMLANLSGWAVPLLDRLTQGLSRGYQSYIVLTLCRILYTLEHGAVVSKPVAARWAKENLDQRWASLIGRAWVGRQNPDSEPDQQDVNETQNFIRYTLERGNQIEKQQV